MKSNLVTIKNKKTWALAGFVFALVLCILLGSKSLWVEAAPGEVNTADSRADGITMNLFDYWGRDYSGKTLDDGGNVPPSPFNVGINQNHSLKFTSYGVKGSGINHFTGANQPARTGIVKKTLGNDGYPVLSGGSESLKYLFDTNNINNAKNTYANVNHLMTRDGQGTYQYDSNKNYAYYNSSQGSGGNFKVYNGTYNTSNNSSYKIGFFPFTDYNSSQTYIDNNTPNQPYSNINHQYYNHHFGMTMNANFSLPHNGKLPNGKDMVFEYSGDDDMWLYIDGVLVLDIGGIHEPVHGTINFATGEVKIWPQNNPSNVKTTTLSAIFAEQGINWRNDTNHKFDMFYLERGGQYSNLALTLNIPITKTVTVNKSVEGEQSADYLNKDFQFQALVDKGDGRYVPYEGNVEIYGKTKHVSDGKFTLKPTQNAKLLDMKSNWKYKIVELGLDGSHFSGVDISGSDTQTVNLSDGQSSLTASSAGVSANAGNNVLNFKNKIREEKKNITVEKKWEGDSASERPAKIQFRLYRIKNGDTAHKEVYRDASGATTFTLTSNDGWRKTFGGLVMKSGTDNYTYEVEEISVPTGYVVSYSESSGQSGTTLTIKNEMKTKVKVEKKWQQADGSPLESPPDKVKVQLYQYKMAEKTTTVPNPPPTETVPVTFTTRYHGAAGSNGGNSTSLGLTSGDLGDFTYQVPKGGSITFTVRSRSTGFGVHQVKAGEQTLSATNPVDTDITNRYQDGGQWKNMRVQATYTLSNVNNATTVETDMIGWLQWVSGTLSLKASMDYIEISTAGSSSGGTTTITTKPTPPKKMSDIQDTENLKAYPNGEATLTANGWSHTFGDLPVQTTENGKTYYYFYYVKEVDGPSGFTTTYEGNDGTSGNVTIKNVKDYFPFGFTKVDSTDNNKYLAGAEFSLYKDEACQNIVGVYLTKEMQGDKVTTFSSDQQGNVRVFGLKPGVYYLKEIKAPNDYYLIEKPMKIEIDQDGNVTVLMGNPNIGIDSASHAVLVKDNPIYELPNAGGIGTHVLTLLGSMMLTIGALILYSQKKHPKCQR
ncbi:SpaA isopeptide-forming pilin-related protein [Pseudoramibacter sp. HA2172]|uniref:SpaA isopeptide-forming pilin-related protein n=1 Tax=Pseudoramibacter faecis TaxID=3108534 RepID=UPI002E783E07|nr:SpaA isopeptide-forming pilin-related protein [Pseudoramibacter sp. HA2172]